MKQDSFWRVASENDIDMVMRSRRRDIFLLSSTNYIPREILARFRHEYSCACIPYSFGVSRISWDFSPRDIWWGKEWNRYSRGRFCFTIEWTWKLLAKKDFEFTGCPGMDNINRGEKWFLLCENKSKAMNIFYF